MLEAIDPDLPQLRSLRSEAYADALRSRGMVVDPELIASAPWGGDEGAASMGRLLSLPEPPTAVFAHSDEVAVGALRTLRQAGLTPGRDISVIGIDDHPIAGLTDLTTIRQQPTEQGRRAAALLLELLQGQTLSDREVTLPTQLVVRGTTAPAPPGAR